MDRIFAEKRNHKRFTVQEGTFAALRNHGIRLGVIKDISGGGFALHYIEDGNLLHGSIMLDGFFKGKNCYLRSVPVRIISDIEVEDRPPFSSLLIRRCGIKFKEMTASRMSQVERFIENYAL